MKKRLYQALSALGVLLFLSSFYVPVKGEPLMVLGSDTTPPVVYGMIQDLVTLKYKTFSTDIYDEEPIGRQIRVSFRAQDPESGLSYYTFEYTGGTKQEGKLSTPRGTEWGISATITVSEGYYYFIFTVTNGSGIRSTLRPTIKGVTIVYTLTISCSPPNGGTTSPAPGVHTYTAGTEVTVTASANSGYIFNSWTGSVSSTYPTIKVLMDSNKSLTAGFAQRGGDGGPVYYTLTTSVDPPGSGSVGKNPDASSYVNQTKVTIWATPARGWYFKEWRGDATGNQDTIQIIMDRNKTITACFARKDQPAGKFYINNQLCTPTSTLYLNTKSLSFKFVPDPSKSPEEISRVWVEIRGLETRDIDLTKQSDGSWTGQYTVGKDGTYTINCKLSWVFGQVTIASITFGGQEEVPPGYAKIEYICLPRIGGGLVGAKSPVPLGTHIEVEAFPNRGWRFVGWKGDVPPGYTYQKLGFIADKENMVIIAEFKSIEPMISTPTAMRIFGVVLILSGAVGWLVERKKHAW